MPTQICFFFFKAKVTLFLLIYFMNKAHNLCAEMRGHKVALSIAYKADFGARKIIRDKERHCITIRGSLLQEDLITCNVYAHNNKTNRRV